MSRFKSSFSKADFAHDDFRGGGLHEGLGNFVVFRTKSSMPFTSSGTLPAFARLPDG